MKIQIYPDKQAMGLAAAEKAAEILREVLGKNGKARIIAATGASQFEFLESLTQQPGIDWKSVTMFHLDEYIGLPDTHPASFRKYLKERLIQKVGMGVYHLIPGDAPDPLAECRRVGALWAAAPIDVAFIGIGENGHLAFNDPPADFDTQECYIIVDLDDACRRQQLGEGWFPTFDDVPSRAISMTVSAIMKSQNIICTVPDRRKAEAVRDCLAPKAQVSNLHPASIIKRHPRANVFLDQEAAALLR